MRQGWIRQCGLIPIIFGLTTGGVVAADEIVLGSRSCRRASRRTRAPLSGPTADLRSDPLVKKGYLGL